MQSTSSLRYIPNLITLLNLGCGVLSIYLASFPEYHLTAAMLIFFALLFDFADGFFARLLNASSEVGKQLDSLSDMVSFGIAPIMLLMHSMVFQTTEISKFIYIPILLSIPLLSALRLAKFNTDERQSTHFIGLPTPANAILLTSLFLMQFQENLPGKIGSLVQNEYFVLIVICLAALMLNSKIKLFSLKPDFNNTALTILQLSLVAMAVVPAFFVHYAALFASIVIYVLLSVIFKRVFENSY